MIDWSFINLIRKMIAYKLFRKLKNGDIAPLFINKKQRIKAGVWLEAEDHPTKGFAHRPGWHCAKSPEAPHLSEKGRVWCSVEVLDYEEHIRPANQGGCWILAKKMKLIGEI
jgi:hypothetical protein